MDIYWPAFILLMYVLCGFGFTIQGIYALAAYIQHKREARADQAG